MWKKKGGKAEACSIEGAGGEFSGFQGLLRGKGEAENRFN